MAAIITNKFRLHNAEQFHESLVRQSLRLIIYGSVGLKPFRLQQAEEQMPHHLHPSIRLVMSIDIFGI